MVDSNYVTLNLDNHIDAHNLTYMVHNIPKGGSLNHVDGFLDFFDPPLPPMWIILLNKGYVLCGYFENPPSPLNHPHGLRIPPSLT